MRLNKASEPGSMRLTIGNFHAADLAEDLEPLGAPGQKNLELPWACSRPFE